MTYVGNMGFVSYYIKYAPYIDEIKGLEGFFKKAFSLGFIVGEWIPACAGMTNYDLIKRGKGWKQVT
jgi:hypothetical protein